MFQFSAAPPTRISTAARAIALTLLCGVALFADLRIKENARAARPIRVATYNIRRFGIEETDLDRLGRILNSVDADIWAVQEIQSRALLERVARGLSTGGRRYRVVLSECGGKSRMHLGFVYDSARVALSAVRELPELDPDGDGRCRDGERPALLARFRDQSNNGAREFALLTVHLAAGGSAEHAARRRVQWDRALAVLGRLRSSGVPAALVGDTNSTGFLDNAEGERDFIERRVAEAQLELATRPLACSEYFPRDGRLLPSLLDHVAASPGFARDVALHGYCAELACRPHEDAAQPPAEFATVSDHCPVSFSLR